jgi:hypothetical protein
MVAKKGGIYQIVILTAVYIFHTAVLVKNIQTIRISHM